MLLIAPYSSRWHVTLADLSPARRVWRNGFPPKSTAVQRFCCVKWFPKWKIIEEFSLIYSVCTLLTIYASLLWYLSSDIFFSGEFLLLHKITEHLTISLFDLTIPQSSRLCLKPHVHPIVELEVFKARRGGKSRWVGSRTTSLAPTVC